jgi:hypothetical protein
MMRESERANGNAFRGDGNGAGVGVVDTPARADSIFIESDERNAATVVVGDDDERHPDMVLLEDEGDIITGVETERGVRTGEGRGRKRAVGGFLIVAGLVGAIIVTWFMFGSGATRKARLPVNGAGNTRSQESEDGMTRQAIDQLHAAPGVTFADGSKVSPHPSPGSVQSAVTQPQISTSNEPVTQLPQSVNPNLSSTVEPARSASPAPADQSSTQSVAKLVTSDRNNERSIRIADDAPPVKRDTSERSKDDDDRAGVGAIAVPSFGSMLPVRTLGALYTLRTGGLVRFELTRDVKGKGWSLPHGTVLVGALRGAEYDRAFISLIGFIDSETGRFVKITGDVLGSDGGAGVRGKLRKLSSSWAKVLGKLGEAGLSMAGGLAGSVGRRPVVITDAFGGVGYRVTSEFDGVFSAQDRDTFVEVSAGTSGYVMITELPEAIQGVDALAKFSGREVENRADSDQRRKGTGISEHELADLIQSGDVDRIKQALPRMTVEMRRVAETVIAQGEK